MLARSVLAVFAVAFGASAVVAQSDPVTTRENLMKENGRQAGILVKMMRGQEPYNAAAADAAFAQWADTAKQLPALFPDNAKTGGDNRASPKIWENKKDFEAKIADFAKVVADNRGKAKESVDGLKAAVAAVGKSCDDCHKDYRLTKK